MELCLSQLICLPWICTSEAIWKGKIWRKALVITVKPRKNLLNPDTKLTWTWTSVTFQKTLNQMSHSLLYFNHSPTCICTQLQLDMTLLCLFLLKFNIVSHIPMHPFLCLHYPWVCYLEYWYRTHPFICLITQQISISASTSQSPSYNPKQSPER